MNSKQQMIEHIEQLLKEEKRLKLIEQNTDLQHSNSDKTPKIKKSKERFEKNAEFDVSISARRHQSKSRSKKYASESGSESPDARSETPKNHRRSELYHNST